jgi:maltokinase
MSSAESHTDVPQAVAAGDLGFLDEQCVAEWLVRQRWFGAKASDVGRLELLEALPLSQEPPLAIVLVEVRQPSGTHELYQLPLGFRPVAEGWSRGVICEAAGWTVYDALADPTETMTLARLAVGEEVLASGQARMTFHLVDEARLPSPLSNVRAVGAEQSNTSLVFDDRLIMKLFRRIEPGPNPELEMLRFLDAHGFPNIAPLVGWAEYASESISATLAIVQEYVAGGRDGWELALEELAADPARFVERLRALGAVTGRMHTVLGSDSADPDFSPEEPSSEALALLIASIDEEIEQVFAALPNRPELGPIAGRGGDVQDHLDMIARISAGGRSIRTHGDLHLGQTLLGPDDRWIVLDFEGEPARSLIERRHRRSPLRDVAGMLRSFAYAAAAAELQHAVRPPEGWEQQARDAYLEGYLAEADPSLLPAGAEATRRLLTIFELEKAVYELRYELDHRPDWAPIPVAAIARLLEDPTQ